MTDILLGLLLVAAGFVSAGILLLVLMRFRDFKKDIKEQILHVEQRRGEADSALNAELNKVSHRFGEHLRTTDQAIERHLNNRDEKIDELHQKVFNCERCRSMRQVKSLSKHFADVSNNLERMSELRAIFLSLDQAEKIVKIGLNHDVYELLCFVSQNLLGKIDPDKKDLLTLQLRREFHAVLSETREFFAHFVCSRGSIAEKLERELPFSEGLDGEGVGDNAFNRIVDEIMAVLDNDDPHEIGNDLNRVAEILKSRRDETLRMLIGWLRHWGPNGKSGRENVTVSSE